VAGPILDTQDSTRPILDTRSILDTQDFDAAVQGHLRPILDTHDSGRFWTPKIRLIQADSGHPRFTADRFWTPKISIRPFKDTCNSRTPASRAADAVRPSAEVVAPP
jgi:hypothetical protein